MTSLPSRGRGLKFRLVAHTISFDCVAPFTGAWIEIPYAKIVILSLPVAPFTGAWIEIVLSLDKLHQIGVAPFTGAWIEIGDISQIQSDIASLPSRGRGLKCVGGEAI